MDNLQMHDFQGAVRRLNRPCAECRRSKLRCDRIAPCTLCVKRGCSNICPDGVLDGNKANKLLVDRAQTLVESMESMKNRIEELERELSKIDFQSDQAPPPKIGVDPVGVTAVGVDGVVSHVGPTAASEFLSAFLPDSQEKKAKGSRWWGFSLGNCDLPPEILQLAQSCPFGVKDCNYPKSIFRRFIPPREIGLAWSNLLFDRHGWLYKPIKQEDYMENIFEPMYNAPFESIHPHIMAVFFIIIASGLMTEPGEITSRGAENLYFIAEACTAYSPVTTDATTWVVVMFSFKIHMAYNYSTDPETAWLATGLCNRLAMTIGLERNCSGWTEPEEDQRRRILFWELYNLDQLVGFAYGRPPVFHIASINCPFPDLLPTEVDDEHLGFQAWKFRYAARCKSALSAYAFNVRTPPYSVLLELDHKIGTFIIPTALRLGAEEVFSEDTQTAMQQFSVIAYINYDMLCLHRSYFTEAIRSNPLNPLQHKFAASVLATYKSARRVISSFKKLLSKYWESSYLIWGFWSLYFTSCIVLAGLVIESPLCTLAEDSMKELDAAARLFIEGSVHCNRPATAASLEKILQRAHRVYRAAHEHKDPAPKSDEKNPSVLDELDILAVRSGVVVSRSSHTRSLSAL